MDALLAELDTHPASWKSQSVKVAGMALAAADITKLQKALIDHWTIKSLEMNGNTVSCKSIVDLVGTVPDTVLVSLRLLDMGLDDTVASAVACSVQSSLITKVDLTANRITHTGALALAKALEDSPVESLVMGRNRIGEQGAGHLAKALRAQSVALRILDLGANGIRDEGLVQIAEALPNSLICSFATDHNRITHAGFTVLCDAIKRSPRMKVVSAASNQLPDASLIKIAETLEHTNLTSVCLAHNMFARPGYEAMAQAMAVSRKLEVLDFRYCTGFTDDVAEMFLRLVRCHPSMREIKCGETQVSPAMAARLKANLDALYSNRAKVTTTLCSVRDLPRLGVRAGIKVLPKELLRRLALML